MDLEQLYQEVILDHHKNPRCQGCINCPDANCCLKNPLCGDHIELSLNVDQKTVSEIRFSGHGCAISQASASMMTELTRGKTVEEASKLAGDFRSMMRGEKGGEQLEHLGDAVALEGVRQFSARVKCAMLAWEALERCLDNVKAGRVKENGESASNPASLKVLK